MDEGELRRIVEARVRAAIDSRGIGVEGKPTTDSIPRFNFRPGQGKGVVIAANWKMHMTLDEASAFASEMRDLPVPDDFEVVICPPHYLLVPLAGRLVGTKVSLGAQNMHPEPRGAFTGEHSPTQLLDAGCRYVILGHSERRHVFGERDSFVNRKVLAAINVGLSPILCIGETLEERDGNRTNQVLRGQLRLGLKGLTPQQASPLIIAYEPVWAIGTGVTPTPKEVQEVHALVRSTVRELLDHNIAKAVPILYGGSVKPSNAEGLFGQRDVNGFLIGGASLDAGSLRKIIESVSGLS